MREIDRIGEILPDRIDALLVAGGTRPARNPFLLAASRSEHIVAIDSGVRHVRHFAITPDIIIGDMDSAKPSDLAWAKRRRTRILQQTDQDSSDMDKALSLCREQKWRRIVFAAADGSRPDHFMYALGKVGDFRQGELCYLFRNAVAIALSGRKKLVLPICKNRPFSWLGCTKAASAALSGAQWPFRIRTLEHGKFGSLSNCATEKFVTFSQASGQSLIIIPIGNA